MALPKLPSPPAKEMAGPTPWSNWVIPGRVIAGAYPASLDDQETERILTLLLELGINTFVCLQAEVNIDTPERAWRSQLGLRPYIKDAQKILSKAHETGNRKITQQKIDFLHLPIIDGNVTTDSAMSRLADDCMERVLKGENLYIHCWGGHGRTGTLVATMLGRLYNLPYQTAIRHCQAYHDSRIYPQGVRSPQTPVQRAQVRRLLAAQSAVSTSAPVMAMPSKSGSGSGRPNSSVLSSVKPAGSILAQQGRQSSIADPVSRTHQQVAPSPLRGRPGVSVTPNRYGAGRSSVGESPMRQSSDVRSSQSDVDRLAVGFSKMAAPSAGSKDGYGMPQRVLASNAMLRRSVPQEVNAR